MKAFGDSSRRPHGFPLGLRSLRTAGWLLPGMVWALMPKCPACVAGYLAAGTGLGVSVSTAASLRAGLLALSAGALALFAVKGTCHLVRCSFPPRNP